MDHHCRSATRARLCSSVPSTIMLTVVSLTSGDEWMWHERGVRTDPTFPFQRSRTNPVGVSMGAPLSVEKGIFWMSLGVPSVHVDNRDGEGERDGGEREREDERDPLLLHTLGVSPNLPGVSRPEDNIVKGVASAFVDLGARCPRHVLVIAGERWWLKAQTRWMDMLRQAMAAKRWGAGGGSEATTWGGHDYSQNGVHQFHDDDMYMYDDGCDEEDSDLEDDEEGDEEEDEEVTVALEMTVKEMAIGDWARGRILDGGWLAPADTY